MENSMTTVVDNNPVKLIQIPPNLKPGDSFLVYPENGVPFTVIVPVGAVPGSFITVVSPSSINTAGQGSSDKGGVEIEKATAGAALAAGVAGLICFGVVGGVILAGGAAYVAATQKENKVGKTFRFVGEKTFNTTNEVQKWVGEQCNTCRFT